MSTWSPLVMAASSVKMSGAPLAKAKRVMPATSDGSCILSDIIWGGGRGGAWRAATGREDFRDEGDEIPPSVLGIGNDPPPGPGHRRGQSSTPRGL